MPQQYEYPLPPLKRGYFSSLRIPNFRLYIAGHFISMIGVWMQIVALSWLVWRLTGSADWLGMVGFASRFLTFVFGLIGGAVVDRIFRRNLILITQTLSMFQASVLAILTITGIITPEIIIGLVLFMGAVYAFDFPARHSFITDIVGKKHVNNAVALGSSLVHAARVIGPAIAGFIVAFWGEGACFAINAITFIALIIAVMMIDKSKLNYQPLHSLPIHQAIRQGLTTAWHAKRLRIPLILLGSISFFGMPYYILTPIFISDIYGYGAEQYGFLMASSAVGSLIGALITARSSESVQIKRNMRIASLGFAISLIAFAYTTKFWMGIITMVFIGLFALIALASINAWLQKESPDEVRGRIMGLYTMMFFGVSPFGSLIAGFAAGQIGAPSTLAIGGAICIIASVIFMMISKDPRKNTV